MASRVFAAAVPALVIAIVAGSCSSSIIGEHPIADAGPLCVGGAGGAPASSSTQAATSSASSTHASTSSSGTGGTMSTTSTTGGTGGTTGGTGGTTAGTGGVETTDGGTDAGSDASADAGCPGATDIDCGGGTCPACVDGQHCNVNGDCQSLSCMSGFCVAATCSDNIQNGMETDVDCGGPSCMPCGTGKMCGTGANASNNCQSKVCASGICQAPSCNDMVQNGQETDIDCGGPVCPPCNPGQKCETTTDCVGLNCQTTCQCPTGMVVAPIQGGGIYCIDATEVTYGEYQVFYDANPSTASQAAFCSWNLGWTPFGNWPAAPANVNSSVTNVNWCQAAAYCKYEGRRLCGQIGGGSASQSSYNDFTQDQWYNACTAQGTNAYPYGASYSPMACNGADSGPDGGPGADMPEGWPLWTNCIGGETGLLEMSGNVAEWEDACNGTAGKTDTCLIRGGSFQDSASGLRCDSGGTAVSDARNYEGEDVGFRCCL